MNTEKHFTELTKEGQIAQIKHEMIESAHYLGGWEEFIKLAKELQERDQLRVNDSYYGKY